MSGTKYVQGKDGKFAGSVGSGKSNVPTPADTPSTAVYSPVNPDVPTLNDVYSRYQARMSGTAEDRSWADDVSFSTLNAAWTDKSVVLVNEVYGEEDFNMGGGRLRSGMTVTERVDAAFRAFPDGEPFTDPEFGGMTVQMFRIPSYSDTDGTTLAVKARYGGPVANYELGTLSTDGQWKTISRGRPWLSERIGTDGDPLLDYVDGDIDDWGYGLMVSREDKRVVNGIRIAATTEPREVDPEMLADHYSPSYYDD